MPHPYWAALHDTAVHTYTDHRDDSRSQRGAPSKWGGVSAHHGAVAWQLTKKGIAARKIRHLWDFLWHEENRAVAQGAADLQQHHCPLYRRGLSKQAHSSASVRLSNHIDLNRVIHCLPPGPKRALGQAVVPFLNFHKPIEERGQLWTGLWTRHSAAYSTGPSRVAYSKQAGGSWWTSAHGPPPASHTYGLSTTTHWRTTPLRGKPPGPATPTTPPPPDDADSGPAPPDATLTTTPEGPSLYTCGRSPPG